MLWGLASRRLGCGGDPVSKQRDLVATMAVPPWPMNATDPEWYKLVQVGLERRIFFEVQEEDMLRDAHGEKRPS